MRFRSLILILPLLLMVVACSRDPKVVGRKYLENGNKYFSSGKYKEASIMYRNALRKDPRLGEAYLKLGLSELRLGQPGTAVRSLQRAVELMPDNLEAPLVLSDIYLIAATRSPREAKRVLPEIEELAKIFVKKDPFHGYRLYGLLHFLKGETKLAIEQLDKANQARPNEPAVVMFLVRALAAENRLPEAEKLAKALIEKRKDSLTAYEFLYVLYLSSNRLADAEALLKVRVANNPKDVTGRLQLAQFYFATRRQAELQPTLDVLLGDPKNFPNARLDVGEFWARNREFDKAAALYSAGVQAVPAQAATYRKRLAEVYLAQGKGQEALQILEETLKANPKDDEAIAMRASLKMRGGTPEQIQAAINDLQGVVRSSPLNAVARYDLGRALLAKGEVEQARLAFQDSANARPDYLPPRLAIGQLHLRANEYAKALQAADEILADLDPQNLAARLIRSAALAGMKEMPRARQAIDETLKLYPNSGEARLQLALLDMAQGKFKEAEAGFRKLHEANPADLRSLYGLSQSYVAQKQPDQALAVIQQELSKNPGRDELALALGNTAVLTGTIQLQIGAARPNVVKLQE